MRTYSAGLGSERTSRKCSLDLDNEPRKTHFGCPITHKFLSGTGRDWGRGLECVCICVREIERDRERERERERHTHTHTHTHPR